MAQTYEPVPARPFEEIDTPFDVEHKRPLQAMNFTDDIPAIGSRQSTWKRWTSRLGWIIAALLSILLMWRFRTEIAQASAQSLEQLQALETKLKQAVSAQEAAEEHVQQVQTLNGKSSKTDWTGVDTLFVFGDSYTQTGGLLTVPSQPTLDNPIVDDEGHYQVAPNWITSLVSKYNHTNLTCFNFALGGSTTDDTLVKPFLAGTSLRLQQLSFQRRFVMNVPPLAPWDPVTSAFLIWFGVNDIALPFQRNHTIRPPLAGIFESYAASLESLYTSGARTFLLLTAPPFDRATPVRFRPHAPNPWEDYATRLTWKLEEIADIEAYNARLFKLRAELRRNHKDVSVYMFDTHAFFARVLETPEQFEEMRGVRHTRGKVCDVVEGSGDHYYNKLCTDGEPLSSYAWVNLHATYPVHNAVAARISEDCFGPEGKKGFCL